MPYPNTILPRQLWEARAKNGLLHVQSQLLLLLSMLGVSANDGISMLHIIPLDFYRIRHLPTELYHKYGYEFILVPHGTPIVCDLDCNTPRIYLDIDENTMNYVVSTANGQELARQEDVVHHFGAIDTVEALEAHLPQIMQIPEIRTHATPSSTQIELARRGRKAVLGLFVFYMFMQSFEQIKQDPLSGSLGLLAKLFLFCSVDLELPKKLFAAAQPHTPLRTEMHAAIDQLPMAMTLSVLPSTMLCAMVLLNIFFNNRTRVQNRLIADGIIRNPAMEFLRDDIGGNPILIAAPNHSFYCDALIAIGLLSAAACLVALTGLLTLPPVAIVATGAVAAAAGIGLFVAKKHPLIARAVLEHPGIVLNRG